MPVIDFNSSNAFENSFVSYSLEQSVATIFFPAAYGIQKKKTSVNNKKFQTSLLNDWCHKPISGNFVRNDVLVAVLSTPYT